MITSYSISLYTLYLVVFKSCLCDTAYTEDYRRLNLRHAQKLTTHTSVWQKKTDKSSIQKKT